MKPAAWKALFTLAAVLAGWAVARIDTMINRIPAGADFCAVEPADMVTWVQPGPAATTVLRSASGFYGYGRACAHFIQDVKMEPHSNCRQDPATAQWRCADLLYRMGAWNLPGTASSAGTLPLTREDCERWTAAQRVYTKVHYETAFTLRGTATTSARWNGGACEEIEDTAWGVFPALTQSTYGYDTYRLVVSTKLRASYQEVGIVFSEVVN